MYYTIYKVTNKVNGKFYIGAHQTENLDDGYLGSGTALKRAMEKHGKENFEKEILHVFDTPEEMWEREMMLVEVSDETYNLRKGGLFDLGMSHEDFIDLCKNASKKAKEALREKYGEDWAKVTSQVRIKALQEKYGEDWAKIFRQKANETLREKYGEDWAKIISQGNRAFSGRKHTEETKQKMREKGRLRIGEKNSQFGSMWITNGVENRKIKKDEPIPEGWKRGRKVGEKTMWITNGSKEIRIKKTDEIPNGWRKGRSPV